MALKQTIQDDVKAALKAGDSQKRTVLGMLLSSMKNKELEKRNKLSKTGTATDQLEIASQLTDDEAMDVLRTEIKKRKESITTYEQGGRPELAETEKQELALLMKYMPEQMSEDQVRTIVKEVLAGMPGMTIKDMGKVVGHVMSRVKGKTDGSTVSRIVKEELGV